MNIEKIKEELIRRGFHANSFNTIMSGEVTGYNPLSYAREYKKITGEKKTPMSFNKVKIGTLECYYGIIVDIFKDKLNFSFKYFKQLFDENGDIILNHTKRDFFVLKDENDLWLAIENSQKFIENEEIDN